MLCISSARSYVPCPYLQTIENQTITASKSMKVLGFHFSSEPNVKENLYVLQNKFKNRIWALRHLKRNGFKQNDLVRVYRSMIRPVAEYCSPVYHPLITQKDSHELERIQMQALKTIFGWRLSYRNLLEKSELERLDTRREARFQKLAVKMSESNRFAAWFPLNLYRGEMKLRRLEKYKVYYSSTERYLKSPLNMMRRYLNGLQ